MALNNLSTNQNQTSFLFQICDFHFNFAGCSSSIDIFSIVNTWAFSFTLLMALLSCVFPLDLIYLRFFQSDIVGTASTASGSNPNKPMYPARGGTITRKRALTRDISFPITILNVIRLFFLAGHYWSCASIKSSSVLTNESLLRNVQTNALLFFVDEMLGYVSTTLFLQFLIKSVLGGKQEKLISSYMKYYHLVAILGIGIYPAAFATFGLDTLENYILTRKIMYIVLITEYFFEPWFLYFIMRRMIRMMEETKREDDEEGTLQKLKKKIHRLRLTVRNLCILFVLMGLLRVISLVLWERYMYSPAQQLMVLAVWLWIWAMLQAQHVSSFLIPCIIKIHKRIFPNLPTSSATHGHLKLLAKKRSLGGDNTHPPHANISSQEHSKAIGEKTTVKM